MDPQKFQYILSFLVKVGFGGLKGVHKLQNIVDGPLFFGQKIALFYEINGRGVEQPPHHLTYIFDPIPKRVNKIHAN